MALNCEKGHTISYFLIPDTDIPKRNKPIFHNCLLLGYVVLYGQIIYAWYKSFLNKTWALG